MPQVKPSSIVTHIAGWILVLSLPVLFVTGQSGERDFFSVLAAPATWLFFLTYIVVFYLNTYLLIPLLYFRKKYMLYFTAIALLFAGIFFLKPFDRMVTSVTERSGAIMRPGPPPPDERFPPPGEQPPPLDGPQRARPQVDVVSIFLFAMIIALSMAIRIRQRLGSAEQRALKAEADRANAELSFLKAQINPHFLFNTLNNIYSLAVTKNENTADSIMKLSNIMRYVTDDIGKDYVSLEDEVACISDFIDLQRLRLSSMTHVDFSVAGNTRNKKIAPLILMSFVENIFKHGTSNHEPSDIIIAVRAEENGTHFFCRNKLFDTRRNAERTGIGIANTRQRLAHLYPGRHFLTIKKENGYFTVELVLQD